MLHKIGGVELSTAELETLYNQGKIFIVHYRKVYQLTYSKNAGFGGMLIYTQPKRETLPLTKRGRFAAMNGKELNKLLEFVLVVEN